MNPGAADAYCKGAANPVLTIVEFLRSPEKFTRLGAVVPKGVLLRNRGPAANLRVSGSAADGGRLRVAAGGRLSGTLGGRGFHVNLSARVKVARARPAGEGPWREGPISLPHPALARIR